MTFRVPRPLIVVLVALLAGVAALMPAVAQTRSSGTPARIALLIGNTTYKPGVGALRNPGNDIRLVAKALGEIGFTALPLVENATRAAMLDAVYTFAARLKAAGPDAVGFLYYSGHGVASQGENYLIPVEVATPSTQALRVNGVRQAEVLDILRGEAPNAAHYLVLDACRNTLQGAKGAKGFVPVGEQSGVLIAYATAKGRTASDAGATSGPYAAALAAELVKPGQTDLLMFHNVRVAVDERTAGDQVPWTEDGIRRRERLMFGGAPQPPPAVVPPAPAPMPGRAEVARFCAELQAITSPGMVEALLGTTRGTPMAACAEARLRELRESGQTPGRVAAAQSPGSGQGSDPSRSAAERGQTPGRVAAAQSPGSGQGADPSRGAAERGQPPGRVAAAQSSGSGQGSDPGRSPACDGVMAPVGKGGPQCLKPKDVFRDCPECPEMVVVPAGKFMMGSPESEKGRKFDEGPQRQLSMTSQLSIGRTEITVAQYSACVDRGSCVKPEWQSDSSYRQNNISWDDYHRLAGSHELPKSPVIGISWSNASAYVFWLTSQTGQTYRLPTEAEWEYAARAGSSTPFSFDGGSTLLCQYANVADNSIKAVDDQFADFKVSDCNDSFPFIAPVAKRKPNAWGLYDMHGNVWEWVADCYGDLNRAFADQNSDCDRVRKGGSWASRPEFARSAARSRWVQRLRSYHTGFRVMREFGKFLPERRSE